MRLLFNGSRIRNAAWYVKKFYRLCEYSSIVVQSIILMWILYGGKQ
jgi:hypothetical protein